MMFVIEFPLKSLKKLWLTFPWVYVSVWWCLLLRRLCLLLFCNVMLTVIIYES